MLINVCIEAGGVVYMCVSCLFVVAPQKLAIACLDFKRSKSKFYGTFNELLKIAI